MLNKSSLKGLSLLLRDKVVLETITPHFLFFEVDGETVTYDKRKDLWMCSCIHESWRGNKTNQVCYHIKAAKFYKRRLENEQ